MLKTQQGFVIPMLSGPEDLVEKRLKYASEGVMEEREEA